MDKGGAFVEKQKRLTELMRLSEVFQCLCLSLYFLANTFNKSVQNAQQTEKSYAFSLASNNRSQ